MRLMNCSINRERGCQSQLFVLHRYRKKVFQTVYEVTGPKKPQQKLFHIDKQAGLSNYECPITQK